MCLAGASVAALFACITPAAAQKSTSALPAETAEQRNTRMKWWREARFGMFIHWGVYSVPAGFYHDRPVAGIGEWIMNRAKIPVSEYRAFAQQFNPAQYDPDAWVRLAREAGMKYIVITSKHHDGFGLFDSKVTNWNVVASTPYGKDLLKPLADACHKHGIKLGFYYSQAQDWNHPGGAAAGGHWDPSQEGDMDAYLRNIAVPQVRELLTNYGPVSVLWWDTPVNMNAERAAQLTPLLNLQPGLITNNRLGGNVPGDFSTPEQYIPATGLPGKDWETCMTMNDTWGFKRDDTHWKSAETLIRNLIDIASKGGNYLLNVGPTSEGLIPQPSVERLKQIGRWMKTNGETIYGTQASPFRRLPWGRCTARRESGRTTLYLHVFQWPADGSLKIPGLKNRVRSASLLMPGGSNLPVEKAADGAAVVRVPTAAPDPISTTVVLQIEGAPEVDQTPMQPAANGSFTLLAPDGVIHGSQLQLENKKRRDYLGFWTDPQEWVEWPIQIVRPGRFRVTVEVATVGSSGFELSAGGQKLMGSAPKTGSYETFQTVEVGILELAAGTTTLAVRPVSSGWNPINLAKVVLTPVAP